MGLDDSRQAGVQIEITSQMREVGESTYLRNVQALPPELLVEEVFRAMLVSWHLNQQVT